MSSVGLKLTDGFVTTTWVARLHAMPPAETIVMAGCKKRHDHAVTGLFVQTDFGAYIVTIFDQQVAPQRAAAVMCFLTEQGDIVPEPMMVYHAQIFDLVESQTKLPYNLFPPDLREITPPTPHAIWFGPIKNYDTVMVHDISRLSRMNVDLNFMVNVVDKLIVLDGITFGFTLEALPAVAFFTRRMLISTVRFIDAEESKQVIFDVFQLWMAIGLGGPYLMPVLPTSIQEKLAIIQTMHMPTHDVKGNGKGK